MSSNLLSESYWKDIRNDTFDLAVLPWGATEPHNYHLPYGTDNYETEALGKKAVEEANKKGARSILLPGIPYGVNTGQADLKLAVNLNPSTQARILEDIIRSVNNSGTRKFLILNGHGGNDFKQILRELGASFPDMILATCNWYQSVEKSRFFTKEGDHADEMETSLMLHLYPRLVLPLEKAGSGRSRSFAVKALNEKWAWSERKWSRVTDDTGIGDPSHANSQKGKEYFEAVVARLAELIYELYVTGMDGFYGE